MNDMSAVIIPKSDQLNADDLIAGPITIKVTGVNIRPGTEQPISISFEGDNGKPWKPCKSMCRVMVTAWGADSKKYAGRWMTLFREPTVKWGGMEVGGIRISHMSDIDSALTMALTMTRANKKPFTVKPILASKTATRADAPPAVQSPASAPPDDPAPTDDGLISEQLAADLYALRQEHKVPGKAFALHFNIEKPSQLPAAQYLRAVAWIKSQSED